MALSDEQRGRYRVLLIGVGNNTKAEEELFCSTLSNHYSVPLPQIRRIVDRCPVILKKDLPLKKAELLAKILRSFGARVSIEEKREGPPIVLEFQKLAPQRLALESCSLQKSRVGTWSVTGRVKNISDETLSDIWVLIQAFDDFEEFVVFEETPLAINPLPSGQASPFKVIFEGSFSVKKILVAFKNASGQPVSAEDKRRKKEWMKVDAEAVSPYSLLGMPVELKEKPEAVPTVGVSEKAAAKKEDEIPGGILVPPEREVAPPLQYGIGEIDRAIERVSEESLLRPFEPLKKAMESASILAKKSDSLPSEESENAPRQETSGSSTILESERLGEEIDAASGTPECSLQEEKRPEESGRDASAFQEATQLLKDISEKPKEGGREERAAPSFSWMEVFREAVNTFYQTPHGIFPVWFDECRKQGEFKNSLHSLLTILVYSRFDQGSQSSEPLENTQKLFRLIVQPKLLPDEIPSLNGTSFASREAWKDLFQRALPKVRQIGNAILERRKWNVFDLERLIQVIPQMGAQNSRMAIQWIDELLPDVAEIDFSDAPVAIGEGLYRVAARLGIVDPHLDYCHGRDSIGDTKIQSFAIEAFPHHPVRIEKPMMWVGEGEEQGGHCFPIQPRCDGCLFKAFCARLYLDFDPSEIGVRD